MITWVLKDTYPHWAQNFDFVTVCYLTIDCTLQSTLLTFLVFPLYSPSKFGDGQNSWFGKQCISCWNTVVLLYFSKFISTCTCTTENKSPIYYYMLRIQIICKEALDFDLRAIFSFRSPFLTLRFSLKIKSVP